MRIKRPKICGIYKISNILDDKKYIGSAKSINGRWSGHKSDLRKCKHDNKKFQNWVNKYSINYLIFEVIELCTEEMLLIREQWYLDNIIDWKNDWNICKVAGNTLGVKCPQHVIELLSIPVAQYDLEGKFIKRWVSASEAARVLNFNFSGINDCCRNKALSSSGFQWKYFTNEENIDKYIKPVLKQSDEVKEKLRLVHSTKPIGQYTLDGKFIRRWDSAKLAGRELKITDSNINSTCKLKCASAGGYQWRYYTTNDDIEPCYRHKRSISLIADDVVIQEYNSIAEASKSLDLDSRRVLEVCQGKLRHIKGYKFKYN